jgi:hypothetical protein
MAANDLEVGLTAYCGLYCGDCVRYASKVTDLACDLNAELEKVKFSDYVSVKSKQVKDFEFYEHFLQVIDAVTKLKCSTPCRKGGDGCLELCQIKACVLTKGFTGCWECEKLVDCKKFEFLKPFSGDLPKENARKIKEYGLNKWVEHRSKFYSWL